MSLRRRPVGPAGFETELYCDRCGHPAEWRHRVTSACCMFGEALCEKCERQRSLPLGRDNYWADLRGDVLWLTGKLAAIFGRFKLSLSISTDRLVRQNFWP